MFSLDYEFNEMFIMIKNLEMLQMFLFELLSIYQCSVGLNEVKGFDLKKTKYRDVICLQFAWIKLDCNCDG